MKVPGQHRDVTLRRSARAFTLVEAMLATAVLVFIVAALSQAVVVGQMQTYDAIHSNRAIALGEALMEEILSHPYDDPGGGAIIGPDPGEDSRADFNDIDDYHGFEEAAGELADAAGQLYPVMYQKFTRRVTVETDSVEVPAFGIVQDGLTVTVTVQEGTTGRQWTTTRFVPEPVQ